jgi:hypothetical protein
MICLLSMQYQMDERSIPNDEERSGIGEQKRKTGQQEKGRHLPRLLPPDRHGMRGRVFREITLHARGTGRVGRSLMLIL